MRFWGVYGATILVVLSCGIGAWQERSNSLSAHEGWIATKATHEVHLMGSGPFVEEPQALHGNRLNLHAWHGYQEVWRSVDSTGIDGARFDLYLDSDAYLCFWWAVADGRRHGVLLSNRSERRGGFLVMDGEGRFLRFEPHAELESLGRDWHRLAIDWAAGEWQLNGAIRALPGDPGGSLEAIGFRGGREVVLVDGVRLWRDGEVVYRERFFNTEKLPLRLALVGLAAMLLVAAIEALARRMGSPYPLAARASLCATAIMVVMGFYGYVRFIETRSYPDLSEFIAFFDEDFRARLKARFRSDFERAYGAAEPQSDALRVLFLGGSQTLGVGASTQERSFASRIEGRLRQELGRPVVSMNGGVRSAQSAWLAEQFGAWMSDYEPDAVVLNVSSNDDDITAFGVNLAEIARICDRQELPLLVVCEAESPEHSSDVEVFHTALRSVAARLGVVAVEAHAYLQEHENTGLLWWDHVHPTDYGHALLAECIYPAVYGILHAEKRPTPPPITRVPRTK